MVMDGKAQKEQKSYRWQESYWLANAALEVMLVSVTPNLKSNLTPDYKWVQMTKMNRIDVFFQWYNPVNIHFLTSFFFSPLFTSTACCATSCAFPALHQHCYVRQHLAIRVHHLLCGAQVRQATKRRSTKKLRKVFKARWKEWEQPRHLPMPL